MCNYKCLHFPQWAHISFWCLSSNLYFHGSTSPSLLINNGIGFGFHGYRLEFEAVVGAVMFLPDISQAKQLLETQDNFLIFTSNSFFLELAYLLDFRINKNLYSWGDENQGIIEYVCVHICWSQITWNQWINLNTFDDEGVSWGYEAPIISVKTNVDIRKDLIKMPLFGKDHNWSSTLINTTILQIYRQQDFVHFATHKMARFVRIILNAWKHHLIHWLIENFGLNKV